jgi:hypothetical protein
MSLWEPGAECYGLNMKCHSQASVLKAWTLAGSAILGGGKNFGNWALAGGSIFLMLLESQSQSLNAKFTNNEIFEEKEIRFIIHQMKSRTGKVNF